MGDNRVCSDQKKNLDLASNLKNINSMTDDLIHEEKRLATFSNWPADAPVEASKLAKAGFHYVGPHYAVKCFSCKKIITNWDFGDQAYQRHVDISPECDFIKDRSNNVPYLKRPPAFNLNAGIANTIREYRAPYSNELSNSQPSSSKTYVESAVEEKTWDTLRSLTSEAERLKTFKGWPVKFIKPEDLSRAGFFYLKEGDKVQCFFCKGIVAEWEEGDEPRAEHLRHFPICLFINGMDVGNLPFNGMTQSGIIRNSTQQMTPEDVTGRYKHEMEIFSFPEKGHQLKHLDLEGFTGLSLSKLGITKHSGPRHPKYKTVEARIRSFQDWPRTIPQKPQQLAEAGFFYAGVSDHVRCFYCDGGLRNWESTDDPWIEHARWFGSCCYVMLTKGTNFIIKAVTRFPPVLNEATHQNENQVTKVSAEEIKSLLESPIVQEVLKLGIPLPIIQQALQKRIREAGEPFPTPEHLYEACHHIQKNEQSSFYNEIGIQAKMASSISEGNSSLSTSQSTPNMQSAFFMQTQESGKKGQDQALIEENQRLKEMQMCKICMDEEVGVVFLPCGHLISCPKCAPSITDCPLCRKPISHTIRTFLS